MKRRLGCNFHNVKKMIELKKASRIPPIVPYYKEGSLSMHHHRILTFLTAALLCGPAVAQMPEIHTTVNSGTLHDSCGPTDGSSFVIMLPESHIEVWVYSSFSNVTRHGGAATFQADPDKQNYNGGAAITACNGKGKNCVQKAGMVSITTVEGDTVTGTVQYLPAPWGRGSSFTENHTFRVKRIPNETPLYCG
jgi:hypothetical protein